MLLLAEPARAQVYYPAGMGNTNLSLWLDANEAASLTIVYNSTGTTASGTSGSSTLTTQANISATTPVGSQLRVGTDVTNTYTVTAISATTITVTPVLASSYSGATVYKASVSQWNDKSGGSRHATQPTVGYQPDYLKNAQNGLPAISFPNTSAVMGGPGGTYQTIVAERMVKSGALYHTLFASPLNADFSLRSNSSAGNRYGDGSPFNGQDWANSATPSPACWINGTNTVNYTFAQYHVVSTYSAGAVTSNYSLSTFFMSRGMTGNDGVGEMIVTSNALSNTNRQLLEGYLAWKWGNTLTAGPYINSGTTNFKSNLVGIGRVSVSDSTAGTQSSNGLGFTAGTGFLQDNGDYLTALDNNAAGTISTVSSISRLNRVWYITKTDVNSNGGALSVYFDYAMLTGATPGNTLTNYQLIYHATDPAFPTSGTTTVASAASSVTGSKVLFTVNATALANGYYTLRTCNASAAFSYAAASFCSNGGTAAVTLGTGATAGTFTASPAGLSLNASTGAVALGSSTAGTYTVTNTATGTGSCTSSSTAIITVTAAPAATISYTGSPYCSNAGTVAVTRTGTAGGTYSSTTGLTINASTGDITTGTSTAGTYTVTYTVAASGVCAGYSTTTTVTITTAPSATISYASSPYCSTAGTATVTRTGTAGGTYSSTSGLTINATTGSITTGTSTAGTYTVTYTVAAAGGCAIYTTTTAVIINAAPSATISYTGSPYCSNAGTATVTRTGTAGGTFSSTTGLTINTTTGEVDPASSTAGTYTVTYTVTTGGCAVYSTTTSVTITAAPVISQVPVLNIAGYYKFPGNANDETGTNNGTFQNSPLAASDRFNNTGKAIALNGSSQYVSTSLSFSNPVNFTISIWFRTTTTTGGKLIGFGSLQTGLSNQNDRHLYMSNSGQVYFGIYNGSVSVVNSSLAYNDGNWHLATATLSAASGMVLYMDGVSVGTNSATQAENYTGWWRIGYDNMNGWPAQPSSYYFNGTLDDALIYTRALSASEAAVLYNSPDGAGNNGPVCSGSTLSLTATSITGATYAWTGPNGFTSSAQNPAFTYGIGNAGVYTVAVTLSGCTSAAYTYVVSSSNAGQWTGNISTDWNNAANWCNGILPTSATHVIIPSGAANMPVITSNASCNNLTVNTGATLTTTLAGTLNIAGLLTNNGTMTNSGTTSFNGTAGQQTFTGVTAFYNLKINNTNGLILPGAITISNDLTISAGTLNANNFNIAVAGTWTNNASVTGFTAGTSVVTFNGTAAQSIGGTAITTFNHLTLSNTGSSVTLGIHTAVAGNLTVAGGTFDLGAFTANRTTQGGILTVNNNAVLKIGGTNTYPVNYASNTLVLASTVEYSGTNQTVADQPYGNLRLSSSGGAAIKTLPATPLMVMGNLTSVQGAGSSVTFTAAADITVSGNISIGASTIFNGSGYALSLGGNWVNNGSYTGNTGTVVLTGSGTSVSGSGVQNFNNLTVAASSVTFSSSSFTLTGNLATTGSGSFSAATGSTLTMSGNSKTISGAGITLENLTVTGSVTTASAMSLTGNLAVGGSFTSGSGAFAMSGSSRTITGAGAIAFNNLSVTGSVTTNADFSVASSLTVSGSFSATAGTATFTGSSSLNGTANLYNTTINGTSLKLTANSTLGISNLLTVTAGTLDVTSSVPNTVNFNGTGAQNINGITYNNLILSNGNTKTASAAITVAGVITIGTGTAFVAGSYTHTCYTGWINNGSFSAGSGTIRFSGTGTSDITGATTFNILTIDQATTATSVLLHSSVSAAVVNMIKGTIYTGTNTLTITNTRTGNDFIFGTIRRTHAFTTGVAYAFEGPNNTISFSSLSGVTSVTVYVNKGVIADFPFGGSISRVYEVTIPSGSYTATLRLHYEDNELNGNNQSSMGLWKYNGTTWGAVGKTANDTSANYVENSGLTDITNRWTLSDNSNVVLWNGSVSTDWNTAANWTVQQGSASRPPAANDIVDLGTAAFNYHPTISTPVTVKNIVFGSVQALNLTMASGGSLVSGDIHGTWTGNATHSININGQHITINGNIELSDGTAGHAINLAIGSGAMDIAGSLTQSGGAAVVFTGTGTMSLTNDFRYTSGTFTAGSGTIVYNGAANQVVGPVTYNNLTINKTAGLASVNTPILIGGNLTVSGGETDNFSTTTVGGNVTIGTGATFINYSTLHVKGNWTNNGTYTPSGGSTYFDGTVTQQIGACNFNNVFINKPVGSSAVLTGNMGVNGNLTVSSGTLDLQTYTCNRTVSGGTITFGDSSTLILGADNAPLNYSTYTISPVCNSIFNGTGTQTLFTPDGIVLGNVFFRNSGTKNLISPFTLAGNLTIESGSNFHAGSQTVTLGGNWLNNGTFAADTSTLLLTGTSKTLTGNTTFNKVTISGSYTAVADITYKDLLYITPTGTISSGGGIFTTLDGDLLNKGRLITSGTTTFTGLRQQTLSLVNATTFALIVNFNGTVPPVLNSTSDPQYGFLNINNTGGVNPSVGWTINYAFTVSSGASFNGGPSTHNILGSVTNNGTITSTGTMNFIPDSIATVNLGSNFSSTGTVVFGGRGALTLAGTPVSFNNVTIANTNAAGITPSSNWSVTHNFLVNSASLFNASGYTYTIGGNTVINGTMNSGTSLFTLNGSAAQDIFTGSPFNNITISKTSGVTTLSSNLPVNGALNFTSGKISTGENTVVMAAGATVTGAAQNTGWVTGNLRKNIATGATTRTFEIGDPAHYTPATIAFGNVSSAGDLLVNTTSTDHPNISSSTINPSHSVNRYWSFTNLSIVFNYYTGTYNFTTEDIDVNSVTAAFKTALYNGSSWLLPVTASPNATSIQATGVTLFGDIAIGQVCNAGTAFSYAGTPYCSNAGTANVTLLGTPGGTFTSSAGLSVNASTGAVNLAASTPGFYSVTYTVAATSECSSYITSANLTITAAPAASISYSGSPFCTSTSKRPVNFSGTAGGRFSAAAGLSVNDTTGLIDPGASTPGTYTVSYTIAASGGCAAYTATTTVTITAAPSATIVYNGNPYCSNAGTAFITRTGTGGGIYTSTSGLAIDAITGNINIALSTPNTYTVTYTVAAAGGCALYTSTTTVSIFPDGSWTGAVNTNWNVAGNWACNAVPIATTNVFISSGLTNYPVVNTGTNPVRNLTIQNGASLTVNGAILQIGGTITSSVTFTATNGTIDMNGASAQTIPAVVFSGNTVKSFTVNNAAGVTLAGALNLTDVLTVSAGVLHADGYLTLQSSATQTARVAPVTSNAAVPVAGNVTVERYIPGRRKYRLMTSSVTSGTASVLQAGEENLSIWGNWQNSGNNTAPQTGTIITGGTVADGYDNQTSNASLFTYNDVGRYFSGFTSANGKNTKYTPLKAGIAYYMFIYGDRTNTIYSTTPNNTVIRSTGILTTGNQVYNATSAIPLSNVTGRFTLLGNPFACPIDWTTIPKTDLAGTYWGWDPNLSATGGYVTVSTTGNVTLIAPFSGTTGLNQYIQSGQGFFVQTSGPSPSLTIREEDKTGNFNGDAFRINSSPDNTADRAHTGAGLTNTREPNSIPLLAVNLLYTSSGTSVLADGTLAAFSEGFNKGVGMEDASKIANGNEAIGIVNTGVVLSIDARPMPQQNDTVFLHIANLSKPAYTMQIFAGMMAGSNLLSYLEDTYLHTIQPLSFTDTNNVAFTVNFADSASYDTKRFRILFRGLSALPVAFTYVHAEKATDSIRVTWQVSPESRMKNFDVQRSDDGISFTKAAEVTAKAANSNDMYSWFDHRMQAGNTYYRIRALQSDGNYTYSEIVVVNIQKARPDVIVFPNPVISRQINLRLIEIEKGIYTLVIHNSYGQQVAKYTIDYTGGTSDQSIPVQQNLPGGVYYLRLSNKKQLYDRVIMVEN